VIAALLHDAVEDQGGSATLREIKRRFGTWVAAIVEACSDSFETPKPPWLERKEEHLVKIHHASASVRLICAADRLHNARCILADYRESGTAQMVTVTGTLTDGAQMVTSEGTVSGSTILASSISPVPLK
jgi:(p)ppGpp synthase/HD superfamily hydrolase